MKNKTLFLSDSNISVEKIYEELSDIKKMLTLIIKKQEAQDLLLSDILIKHNKLEEDTKTYTVKEEKNKN